MLIGRQRFYGEDALVCDVQCFGAIIWVRCGNMSLWGGDRRRQQSLDDLSAYCDWGSEQDP